MHAVRNARGEEATQDLVYAVHVACARRAVPLQACVHRTCDRIQPHPIQTGCNFGWFGLHAAEPKERIKAGSDLVRDMCKEGSKYKGKLAFIFATHAQNQEQLNWKESWSF